MFGGRARATMLRPEDLVGDNEGPLVEPLNLDKGLWVDPQRGTCRILIEFILSLSKECGEGFVSSERLADYKTQRWGEERCIRRKLILYILLILQELLSIHLFS
jgi:hypothetical protein